MSFESGHSPAAQTMLALVRADRSIDSAVSFFPVSLRPPVVLSVRPDKSYEGALGVVVDI
jgi:hypothetical protein